MTNNRKIVAAASLAICAACGGSKTYNLSGTATVNPPNTVGGIALTPGDAVSLVVPQSGSNVGAIVISSQANQCNELNAHRDLKNGVLLSIALGVHAAGSSTITPPTLGTYTIFSRANITGQTGNIGDALFLTTNATCGITAQTEATSGTVTLTRVDENGYGGTFDLMFGTTDHLVGSFNSGSCSALVGTSVSCPP